MTKKYKHLPTGKIYHQWKEGGNLYCEETALPHFLLNGKDWEEVKDKPSSYHIMTYAANEIFSVRRGRDSEEFRVGNIVITNKLGAALPISKIYLNKTIDTIEVECGDYTFNLDDLIRMKDVCHNCRAECCGGTENIACEGWYNGKPKEWGVILYRSLKDGTLAGQSWTSEKDEWEIYSVKRLSDGVEFKIGDIIRRKGGKCTFEIFSLEVKGSTLRASGSETEASYKGGCQGYIEEELEHLTKIEKLFTTEDGVDIYEGDSYWRVDVEEFIVYPKETAKGREDDDMVFANYSTRQAAEEYILMNKPCLSINDLLHNLNWSMNSFVINKLKELAKSKQ